MKLKTKLILVLLVGVALTYTACKKLDDGSSSATVSTKAVSSQVALNLAQTLYSGFGVFNLNGGLNAPSGLGVSREKLALKLSHGKKINDLGGDITCGAAIDTTLNESVNESGESLTIAGRIKFTFLCTNNTPSGFNVFEDMTVSQIDAQISANYKINEDLTLQSLNPLDDNSNIGFHGTLGMTAAIQYKTGSKGSSTTSFNYNFTAITMNSNGEILTGKATFATKGTGSTGTWNYSGTIDFLGNNKVKITINGAVYTADLQTGEVTG